MDQGTGIEHAHRFGIGQPVRRREDERLLRGQGRFTADVSLAGQLHAHLLRSPHPHARIAAIDTTAARSAPGVHAVLTGEDAAADGLGCPPGLSGAAPPAYPKNRDGSEFIEVPYLPLARGRAMYVGHEVALVVAETPQQARDAGELIDITWETLPHVLGAAEALAPGAPQLLSHVPGNRVLDWSFGDAAAVQAAFAGAAHVARLEVVQTRITQGFLEPRAAVAEYAAATGRWTLHTCTQAANRAKEYLADHVFKVPRERFRVISADVGGGFGGKIHLYNEYALVCWAARRLGRPVKWVADRSEGFLSDWMARDQRCAGELALDADGRILALRIRQIANTGAFVTPLAVIPPTWNFLRSTQVLYRTPLCHAEVQVAITNTCPVNIYRGAGRPEGTYIVERLLDIAAAETGLDRAEIRARNFIPDDAFPFRTFIGLHYDSGRFADSQAMALRLAAWDGFPARRAADAARGRLRGIGISNYVEVAGGMPREFAEVRVRGTTGRVEVLAGSGPMGQGCETAYAQLAVDLLGVDLSCVDVVMGDTDRVRWGDGSYATRSMRLAGTAIHLAGTKVAETGRAAAALLLEAAPADILLAAGRFVVAGTDRGVSLFEVARALEEGRLPAELGGALAAEADHTADGPSFPNGCHVCEVSVCPETGVVQVENYVAVDDVGRVINPLIVHGQIHGGIGQGIGQTLLERIVYDAASGQLLTGSFMDYALPRADDLPNLATALNEVPSPRNPLGVKGAGEGGITGALAAVMGALADALSPHGVRHIDMPATPERVLRAMGRL
jgi:carbon-monoxide dehydrogenase large subunit